MKLVIYILFLINTTCATVLMAQQPSYWSLTVANGLPTNEVYDLYQDSKGYMWIATDKGLCRYNGRDFKYYNNKNQKGTSVTAIQETADGRIWVMSFKNEIFYIKNDSLHIFQPLADYRGEVVANYYIDQEQRLWVRGGAYEPHLYYYNLNEGGDWHLMELASPKDLPTATVRRICQLPNGRFYVITDASIYELEGDTLIPIPRIPLVEHVPNCIYQKALEAGMNPLGFNTRLFHIEDELLVFTSHHQRNLLTYKDRQLHHLKGHRKQYESFIESSNARVSFVHTSEGDMWGVGDQGAFCLFNKDSTNNQRAGMHLFPDKRVSDLLVDKEGNYWISTLSSGVYIVPNINLLHYTKENSFLEQDNLGYMTVLDDYIFISDNDGGVYQIDEKNNRLVQRHEVGGLRLLFMKNIQGKVLVPSDEGWSVLEQVKNKWTKRILNVYTLGAKDYLFYKNKVPITSRGVVGIELYKSTRSSQNGKFLFYESSSLFPAIKFDTIKNARRLLLKVTGLLADEVNDRFWALTSKGVLVVPEKIDTIYNVFNELKKNMQASDIIQTINGDVWISTQSNGIYCIAPDLTIKEHIKIDNHRGNNEIRRLVESSDHKGLWLLGTQQLQYWDLTQKVAREYTLEDGIPSLDIRDIEALNGKIYLTTDKGLVTFSENMNSENNQVPSIAIVNVLINDRDTSLQDSYELNYLQNYLTIYVDGISYKSKDALSYEFRMLGIDTIWRSQKSATDFMRFPLLSTGDYTFEVRAVNEDNYKSVIKRIHFKIAPPYWETWWFQGGIYLIVVLIIVGFVIRRNHIKQEEERRANYINILKMQALQSQMNPHFVFNVLTAIQNLWMQKKNEPALQMQSTFAKLLRKIFQYSSRKSISIEEEEEFLNNYLNLEQIRFERSVQINFTIETKLLEENYNIPPLLIQPIIENSFKHGLFHKKSAKKLAIILQKREKYLYCIVEDNGVGRGFNKKVNEPKRSTSGLTTTQDRLTILQKNELAQEHPDNNFKITDLKDSEGNALGTRVELWIPFVDIE